MKTRLLFSALLALILHCNLFSNVDSLFVKANNAYASSNYVEAINCYEEIISQGYGSAELYFNLGNAFYKNNNLARAIVNFEKAKKLKPYDEAINFNLQLANAYKVDQIEEIPEFFLKTWLSHAGNIFSFETWGKLSLLLFVMVILFILLFLFTAKTALKKFSFVFSIVIFVLTITCFSFARKRQHETLHSNQAIITTESVTLKSSPDASGTDLFVVHEGTKVKIKDHVGDWYEIRIADGNTGWIMNTDLEKI